MACPCGGASLKPGAANLRLKEQGLHLELSFAACKACERVGMERLFRNDIVVMSGPSARQLFRRLVEAETKELPDLIATSLPELPLTEPVAMRGTAASNTEAELPSYDQLELL